MFFLRRFVHGSSEGSIGCNKGSRRVLGLKKVSSGFVWVSEAVGGIRLLGLGLGRTVYGVGAPPTFGQRKNL